MKTTYSPFFFLLFSLLLFSLLLFSLLPSYGQSPNCYRITFSDKNDSPYSVNRPEEFLSARAIAKRVRFNIPVIEQDLPVNPHYIDSILKFSAVPSQIIAISKWNNSVVIFYPETDNCHAIIDAMLNHFSFVIDTLPVAYFKLPFISPVPPSTPQSFNPSIPPSLNPSSCDYDYGNSIDNIHLHKGELLHKAGFCGEGMLICVIDAGWNGFDTISYFQPLYENGQIWGTRDLVPGVNNVYIGHKHGTMVTSEMVTAIEGKFVGSAPRANYFFIRSENDFPLPNEQLVEEDFFAQAAEIADSLGADVISVSLCYGAFDYAWQNIFTPDSNTGMASIASRAASMLAQKGVIVAIAAGNMGSNDWHYITRPADAKDILAVGMVNKYGVVNSLSSYGPSADGRVKPDVAAAGDGAWVINEYGKIVQLSGTSCAAPIIAGLSACLWQALPQYSSLEIMDLIRKYGSRYTNPNYRIGYGIPNFYQCYLDQTYGVQENVKSEVLVYPNPTTGELRVESGELKVESVEVFDVYGKRRKGEKELVINISELEAGVYFVKITTEKGVVTKKIIKYSTLNH